MDDEIISVRSLIINGKEAGDLWFEVNFGQAKQERMGTEREKRKMETLAA